MKDNLTEMSLEELWELFPIIIKEYNPKYLEWYQEEKDFIIKVVGKESIVCISHIGSTAVPGIPAKPIVDILLEVSGMYQREDIRRRLEGADWICMSEDTKSMVFNKGYTPQGFADKVFHLHVREVGDYDELYFRDYLCAHEEARTQYGELKIELSRQFQHHRDHYTTAKTEYISKIILKAREEFADKYRLYEVEPNEKIAALFANTQKAMVLAVLQGYMGRVYSNDRVEPTAAQIVIGDFSVLVGEPCEGLVRNVPVWCLNDALLMVPENEEWVRLFRKVYGSKAEEMMRFSIKKEPDVFDENKLEGYTQDLPKDYRLAMIDEKLYHKAWEQEWSRDLVVQFPTWLEYKEKGIGVVVTLQGDIVAGASTYARYDKGIEIEIDTSEQHRRKGLALACGANLILECRRRELYPGWDAHDMRSVALAEKLGYHMDKAYVTFYVERD